MIFRFTIISDEVEDFIREIKIDADATFFDLHQAILDSCHYQEGLITSFFLCNDEWEKEQEIVLEDMGMSFSDEDIYVMKNTTLSDLLEDEKQRMIYVFDPLNERVLFMELSEIIFGERMDGAVCSRQYGEAPVQSLDAPAELNEPVAAKTKEDIGEDFYGDESFDSEEFDPEGFEFSEDKPY